MQQLERLERRVVRRRDALPDLAHAILGSGGLRYARRRLAFPLARTGWVTFFHCLEVAAVALIFDPAFLGPLINVRLLSSLAGSAIWGATEPLRCDVRSAADQQQWSLANQRIARAVRGALLACLCCCLGAIAWTRLSPHLGAGLFSVVDAFIVAVGLRVGINAVARTYHSGVFALRRIYRPRWSFGVADVVDGLGLFALWPMIGPWALPATLMAAATLRAVFTFAFAGRAYRDSPLGALDLRSPPTLLPAEPLRRALRPLWGALSGLATDAHSWVVLWLWWRQQDALAVVAYGLRPLASFLLQLPRVFYPDMQAAFRMGPLAVRLVSRYLKRAAAVTSGAFALILIAAVAWTAGASWLPQALAFSLFLSLAAQLTVTSMEALIAGRVSVLLASAAVVLMPLASWKGGPQFAGTWLILVECCAITLSLWLLSHRRTFARPASSTAHPRGEVWPMSRWLAALAKARPRGRLVRLRVGAEYDGRTTTRLAASLAPEPSLWVTVAGRRELLLFEQHPCRSHEEWVVAVAAVACVNVLDEAAQDAPSALTAAAAAGLLPEELGIALTGDIVEDGGRAGDAADWPTPEPGGVIQVRADCLPDGLTAVGSWGELARIVRHAARGRPQPSPRWGSWHALAVIVDAELVALHLVPVEAVDAVREGWRKHAWRQSMRLSFDSAAQASRSANEPRQNRHHPARRPLDILRRVVRCG